MSQEFLCQFVSAISKDGLLFRSSCLNPHVVRISLGGYDAAVGDRLYLIN
jgi:hypothetical protein